MLALGEAKLIGHIKTIGLYRGKAKNVIALSKILIEQHGGQVPKDREALEALPASAARPPTWCATSPSASRPSPSTRMSSASATAPAAPGKTPLEVELKLLKRTPAEFLQHAHHWLILHGRYVCKARKPDCPACVVRDLCLFKGKTTVE